MSIKIVFLDASTVGADLDLSVLEKYGELTVYGSTSADEFEQRTADCDILIINKIKVGPHNLKTCKNLKLICITATGYDNIDTEYCRERGIAVCNVVGYSTQNVAQITLAMALSLISHLREYDRSVSDGTYTRGGVANILTPVYNEIYGKTWGIVGYGNIGRQVANVARALGCRVVAVKRTPDENVECVDMDTLCRISDIISVHTPLNDGTRNIINADRIALMKKNAIFINVARGAVADEAALTEAILKGQIGGLGVDVYTKDPIPEDHPYHKIAGFDNVYFTPHMAWGSYEARVRCIGEICKNIESYISGDKRNRIV